MTLGVSCHDDRKLSLSRSMLTTGTYRAEKLPGIVGYLKARIWESSRGEIEEKAAMKLCHIEV